MIFEGNVHVVGDHCDTDVMIPGRYLSLVEPAEIAKHIFEEVDPGFVKRVQPGDILMAGRNFGAGSGREHAPFGLKALGLSCIVAASFSRTFYRMAIDLGLPILECEAAARAAKPGQRARVDTASGEIAIDGQLFRTHPMPQFIQDIIEEGGLTPWVKREAARRRASPR
ncbi:MAG: 3-isopropylmalate dehydratase small subunit [Betaproteobacteria bacterium]|nr:MAG: 3-isopropylmalate dehydratase small subunit [Betaproteobacteria bacterium]